MDEELQMKLSDINITTFNQLEPEVQARIIDAQGAPDFEMIAFLIFWTVALWIFFR